MFMKEIKEITPTIQYFLQKSKGNSELTRYEIAAIEYVKNNTASNSPADIYFRQKLSNERRPANGFIPPYIGDRILTHYEQQAIAFVAKFNFATPSQTEDASLKSS